MVEQPGQKAAGKSPQTVRIGTSSGSRPMSADDIQKAKMRALYMQSKNSKKDPLPSAIGDSRAIIPENPLALQSAKDSPPTQSNDDAKTEDTPEPSPVQPVNSPAVNVPVQADENRKPVTPPKPATPPKSISSKVGVLLKMSPQSILKSCKRKQIVWHVPPGNTIFRLSISLTTQHFTL